MEKGEGCESAEIGWKAAWGRQKRRCSWKRG